MELWTTFAEHNYIFWVLLLLLFIIPVLYLIGGRVRFYVKLSILAIFFLSTCGAAAFLSIFLPRHARNAMLLSWIGRNVMARVFGIKCEIKNAHLLDKKSCVIVANHQSAVDVIGMMFIWPYINPAVSVMKKQLAYVGPVGLLAYKTSSVFLDRAKSDKAQASLNAKIEEVKAKQWKIWIFPEGTRNSNHEMLLPFKKGAFHIAVKAQIPIVPIVFAPYTHIYDLEAKVLNPGTMVAQVLPSVSTEGLSADDVPKLAEEVRKKMLNCYLEHIKNNKPETTVHPEKNSIFNGKVNGTISSTQNGLKNEESSNTKSSS